MEGSLPPSPARDTAIDPRCNKKLKQSVEGAAISDNMEISESCDGDQSTESGVAQPTWSEKLFAASAQSPDIYPPYYLGEDEEEKYDGVDALFRCQLDLEDTPPKFGPRVDISKEKFTSLFRQCRGALIIKMWPIGELPYVGPAFT